MTDTTGVANPDDEDTIIPWASAGLVATVGGEVRDADGYLLDAHGERIEGTQL